MKKLYSNNASRQKAYRLRKEEEEKLSKGSINWDAPLEPFLSYFKRMNNLEVIPEFQATICNAMANFDINNLVVCAGRGSSKTMISSTFALWLVDEYSRFIKKPLSVTLISSQPEIYTHIDRIFLSHPELKERLRVEGKSLEIPKANFEFNDTHGYCERLIPTSNSIRSHRCNCLIIDECASIATSIIKTALPLLKEDIAKVILISTPHKERSFFNDLVADTPKEWSLLQYSSELAFWTGKMRKLAKETLTKEEYSIEIEGTIPEEHIKTLLNSKDVESCIENYLTISGVEESSLHFGIDWGYERSLSCLVLTEWSKAYKKVIKCWVWDNSKISTLYEDMGNILMEYNKITPKLVVYADNKPQGFIENLDRCITGIYVKAIDKGTVITNPENKEVTDKNSKVVVTVKSLLLQQLYNLVKTKHLKIPANETELIKQLKIYTKDRVYSNDLVDALMLSIGELPQLKETPNQVVGFDSPYQTYQTKGEELFAKWERGQRW
jgi:hypothetical protein